MNSVEMKRRPRHPSTDLYDNVTLDFATIIERAGLQVYSCPASSHRNRQPSSKDGIPYLRRCLGGLTS